MIAIFLNFEDAQKLCDKVHDYLQKNCPGYNASYWQVPVKHCKEKKWYVEIPLEYEKQIYAAKSEIKNAIATDLSKAIEQRLKPEEGWTEVISKV